MRGLHDLGIVAFCVCKCFKVAISAGKVACIQRTLRFFVHPLLCDSCLSDVQIIYACVMICIGLHWCGSTPD